MLRAFPRRLSIKSHFNPHSVLCHSRSIRIPPPPTTGMIEPGAPIHLNEALGVLPERFEQGRASGELLFFESSAQDVQSGGLKVRTFMKYLECETMSTTLLGQC